VTVTVGPSTAPTIESFTAAPTEIRPGTSATLTWDTTLAASVDIVGSPADSTLPSTFTTDGSAVVSPAVTTTYTLTATNIIGSINANATVTVTPLATGDLVISEIMMSPASPADATLGEWFEIHNPGSMDANLNGLTIATGSATDTIDSDVIVAAGGYALLAMSSTTSDNDSLPTPDFVYSGLGFDDTASDSLSVSDGSTTIDTVAWTSSWAVTAGHSMSLDPGHLTATGNDNQAHWCESPAMWSGATANYGTPGAANSCS
jgi:hypothetical protein